ncbi:MAG: PAS domain S-box protein [Acidobacteriota bacterium]
MNNNRKTASEKSISIVLSAIVIYWCLFAVLHELFSIPPFPLTILPMVASAWFWGTKRGLLSGTFIMLSSLFLIIVFNLHRNNPLTVALVIVISFILGSAAGWVRKLYDREKMQSAMLAEEHKKLLREIEEHKTAGALLKKRYNFDHLVYSISNQFINVSAENIGNVFVSSLKMLCEFLEMERAYFFNSNLKNGEVENRYQWCSHKASKELPRDFRINSIMWPLFKERLSRFDTILLSDAESLPPEKSRQKEFLLGLKIRAALIVPVVSKNTLIGFLGFDSIFPKQFPEDTSQMLKIIGDIFANAILQKQKNEALLASEERFRLLIQHSTDTIGILDVNGYITYVSPSVKSLTGKRPEEWLGKQLYPYLHPDDVGKVKGAVSRFIENPDLPPIKLSLRLPSEEGSTVFMETILNGQLNNPAIKGIVCNSRDMSQHFALQEALRNSRNFLNAIINCASDPMFVKDSSHKYILVNDAFCKLTGRNRQEMIGKTAENLFAKEEAADFFNKNEQVLNEEKIMDFENILTDANNNKHVMASHMSFYKEESGEKFLIANLRDETRRKELEQEVNNALMKEKELSEMKSKFISMVSHEYRTPLTAILSSAELLELFGVDMTSDEKMEHLRGIKNTVQYMTSMLNEVLLINRVESKRLEFCPSSFDLIAFSKELLQRLGICKECEIKINTDFTSRMVFMDEKLLGHILTNLLSNAVKYSPDGATVFLNIKEHKGYINFEIIDKGMGIPEDVQNRLFEPFFRADNVHNISGSGLGLSIVKYCTDLHKGSVSFESKPGEGTKFMVKLPDESISK